MRPLYARIDCPGIIFWECRPCPRTGLADRSSRGRLCSRPFDRAEAQGLPWQAVFDALRSQGREVWAALDQTERRRFIRHLKPFWDARRFRVAPQVETVLQRRRRAGTLEVLAGSVAGVSKIDGEI